MASKVISVSIKESHLEFLKNNELLSPSDIIQSGIDAAITYHKANNVEKNKLLANIKSLQEEAAIYSRYLDSIGKLEEYYKQRGNIIRTMYDEEKVKGGLNG